LILVTLLLHRFPNVAVYTGAWQEWETQPDARITPGGQP
jgi:3-mercaptopyruvate sulfurtransferase SseA